MKFIYIFILFFIPFSSFASKKWVNKHYILYEDYTTLTCLDSTNCYAFTDTGDGILSMYRSTDGGNNWPVLYRRDHLSETPQDSVFDLFRCIVLDSNRIYLTYLLRAIMEISTDGGKTFERKTFGQVSLDKNDYIIHMEMYTEDIGSIITRHYMFLTRDNWETWTRVRLSDEHRYSMKRTYWIDSNNIAMKLFKWRGYDRYNIPENKYYTYAKFPQYPAWFGDKDINRVHFINDTLGYAIGRQDKDYKNPRRDIIWKTKDKGKNWKIIYEKDTDIWFTDIKFKDENTGVILGGFAKIMHTTDGGESWDITQAPAKCKGALGTFIEWIGEDLIVTTQTGGIFVYQEDPSSVDKIIDYGSKIKIKQSSDELLVSIEDTDYSKYEIRIIDLRGNILKKQEISSGQGIVFMPIDLTKLQSGSYLYMITTEGKKVKTGSFVVAW